MYTHIYKYIFTNRSFYIIDASSKTFNNLRICTLHFTDDCIISYTARRCLKDWALPTLLLPSIIIEQDVASTSSIISNLENLMTEQDIASTSNIVSNSESIIEQDITSTSVISNFGNTVSIEPDIANTGIISNIENINIQHNPVVMSVPKCKVHRQKLRCIKKQLYNKKIKIYKQREQIKKLRKKNKWEEMTTDFSSVQKIFLDMIKINLKRAPEVCFLY